MHDYIKHTLVCVPIGNPSPEKLTLTVTPDFDAINVIWNQPYQRENIVKYIIKIPSINYDREETETSHKIKSKRGSDQKSYTIIVTSINLCGSVSEPRNGTVVGTFIGKKNYCTTDMLAYIKLKRRSYFMNIII